MQLQQWTTHVEGETVMGMILVPFTTWTAQSVLVSAILIHHVLLWSCYTKPTMRTASGSTHHVLTA